MKNRIRNMLAAVVLTAGALFAGGCSANGTAAGTEAGMPTASGAVASTVSAVTVSAADLTVQKESSEETVDAVSSASQIFYQDSSLDQEQLWAAIGERKGGCTIATVNEDGTPNLIVAIPGTAGNEHIYFTWADNVSRANAFRTGQAMACYYIYNRDAESKTERNIGARLKLSLEQDEKVIEKLAETDPTVKAGTVFKVEEILPLG